MRRAAALFLVLFAVYAATLGLDAFGDSDYGGDEPHYLLTAESLVDDGDVDVQQPVRRARVRRLLPVRPRQARARRPRAGCTSRTGVGFPLLIAPALRARRRAGRRAVPGGDRRAGGGARLPARAAGGARPVGARRGARRRAVAAVPRLRQRRLPGADGGRRPRRARRCWRCGSTSERLAARRRSAASLLLGPLPWLGTKFVPAGHRDRLRSRCARCCARGGKHARDRRRPRSRCSASRCYVGLNEALYGGPDPLRRRRGGRDRHRRELPARLPRARLPAGRAVHRPRLRAAALGAGVRARVRRAVAALPHAPRAARARRSRHARLPSATATICAAALGAQLLVAAFLAPTMFGFWFPGRGTCSRRCRSPSRSSRGGCGSAPRTGLALAAISVAGVGRGSTWTCAAAAAGSCAGRPDAPFGPLDRRRSRSSATRALAVRGRGRARAARSSPSPPATLRHWRQSAGATRARYSG